LHTVQSNVSTHVALLHDVTGTARVGCIGTVGRWLVPQLLVAMRDGYPKVSPVIVDATTTSLLPGLLTERLDLAVVNLPVTDPEITTTPLFDEDRIVVAPDDHPLAKLERVSLVELGDYELLLEPQGTSFRDELDREAAEVGVTLRPQAEVDGLRLVASLTFEGFGAAVLPATAVPMWLLGAWRRVPVDGLAPRQVGLAHRRRARLSAPARAVRDTLLAVVANAQQPGVHPHSS